MPSAPDRGPRRERRDDSKERKLRVPLAAPEGDFLKTEGRMPMSDIIVPLPVQEAVVSIRNPHMFEPP